MTLYEFVFKTTVSETPLALCMEENVFIYIILPKRNALVDVYQWHPREL